MSEIPVNIPYRCPHCGQISKTVDFKAVLAATPLSPVERSILMHLWRSSGLYVSYERVALNLWGGNTILPLSRKDRARIATRIKRIRDRLPPHLCIHSIKTLGYRLELRSNVGAGQ